MTNEDKIKILLVEDESVISKDIEKSLEKLGYTVPSIVPSGERAIIEAGKINPNMVLMDIVLQGEMDGIKAAEIIRSRFNIPVIYLTAYADEKMLQRAKLTEPFGYIIKPFEDRELHITIELALYRHKSEMEREKLLTEVKEALARVKTLSGFIPICSGCKKIRDEKGLWNHLEAYFEKHSDAGFSHSICPDCTKKLYPDIEADD